MKARTRFPLENSATRGFVASVRSSVRMLALLVLATGVAMADDAYVEGEVLVTFKPAADADGALAKRFLAIVQRFDRLSRHRGKTSVLVREKSRGTARLLAELKADPAVETVEPNYLRRVSATASPDPDFGKLWGLHNTAQTVNGMTGTAGADTRFFEAWALSRTNGTEVVVAVVDTGLDVTHPDLAGNLWTNPGEVAGNGLDDDGNDRIDDIHGFDFTGNTGSMSDSGDHGTHVAGTIAATGGNGLGMTGLQFHAKLLPLKVSSDGDSISTSAFLSAFDYAVAMKERGVNLVAINASYGGGSSSTSERLAIEALRDAGIVLCAAAGNETANNDSVASYPANYAVSNIISVAALTPANQLASYSNYGATTVDPAAPGSEIYSTMPLSLATTGGRLDLLRMIDTDRDSLPDWWENEELGSLAIPATTDPDGDGFTNADEYLAGTDPGSPTSKIAFTAFTAHADGVSLAFPTVNGRLYRIEWTEDLADSTWTPLGDWQEGDGAPALLEDPGATSISPRRFYRLQVAPGAP